MLCRACGKFIGLYAGTVADCKYCREQYEKGNYILPEGLEQPSISIEEYGEFARIERRRRDGLLSREEAKQKINEFVVALNSQPAIRKIEQSITEAREKDERLF